MEIMLTQELSKIYKKVPEGQCSGCARCCHESVGASFAEAQVIYKDLKNMPEKKREALVDALLEYYFDVYQLRKKCPFLNRENRCEIYYSRPLNCRIYGHWNKKDYNDNLNRLDIQNREIAQILSEEYGYKVKGNYLDFSIEYCNSFKGKILSKSERNELYDALIVLDSKMFVSRGIKLAYEDKGIVEHLVDKLLSKEKIFEIKMSKKLSSRMRKRLKNIAKLRIGVI
ncbi:YkgJ family cysteine cluster protein [Proteocatella sphenisci]|uniref:YkgJ family cysteine cluster protein n=1 Tax=Proteocatella sphenisci TaxID=181070 RepID=UPI00048F9F0C|nr:YkgJ family cysteine cluster protein [Proteocatella sphenisci]